MMTKMLTVAEQIASLQTQADRLSTLDFLLGDNASKVLAGAPLYIFGAGEVAKGLRCALRGPENVHSDGRKIYDKILFKAFVELVKTKDECEGEPVLSLDEFFRDASADAVILIGSWNFSSMFIKVLWERGFQIARISWPKTMDMIHLSYLTPINISSIPGQFLVEDRAFDKLNWVASREAEIQSAFDCLEDQHSIDLFVARLDYYLNVNCIHTAHQFISRFSEPLKFMGPVPINGHTPPDGIENFFYFHNEIIKLRAREFYIDIGAFNGDSVRSFQNSAKLAGVEIDQIWAFEPDPVMFKQLRHFLTGVDRLTCFNHGLWSHNCQLRFDSGAVSGGARFIEDEEGGADVVSLDHVMQSEGKIVTTIKMDAPGGSMSIVKGFEKTLTQHRPKLVFGIYHETDTLFEMINYIRSLNLGYRFYLRHNEWNLTETFLYAVP